MKTEVPSVWEEVRERFNTFMVELVESLREANEHLWYRIDLLDSEFFPFRGYVSFLREGDPATAVDDVVVSLVYQLKDGQLRGTVDVAQGDGGFLTEDKEFEIGPVTDIESLRRKILSVESEAERFVSGHMSLLRTELT